MSAVMIPRPRAIALLTHLHVQEFQGARLSLQRLVLMRDYAACLQALGCPVVAWWRPRTREEGTR